MIVTKQDIVGWDSKYRLKFINSISGYKGVHLIGTKSKLGVSNVAIFNSVMHISSEPARIGFLMRPLTVPRDTYLNIKETQYYTINHVHQSFLENAHYTSAKFDTNEFDSCNLNQLMINGFHAPFVAESNIKLGVKLVEDVTLESSACRLIIGEVEFVEISEEYVEEDGQVDLEKADDVCVTGLNQYSSVSKLAHYPYARVAELPNFHTKERPDNVVYDDDIKTYNAHLLPYGTNVGAPSIDNTNLSRWKTQGVTSYNHLLKSKVDKIKSDYEELLEEYRINELIYGAKCDFEPIIGEVYHLYEKEQDGSSFLSMIPPNAWKMKFVGSFKYNFDKVWLRIDE